MTGSDFYQTQFWSVDFSGAQMAGSVLGYTVFQDCDLSVAQGLDEVRHDAPSTIGVDTLYRSGGRLPAAFLAAAGIPGSVMDFQSAITGTPSLLLQVYISCQDEDEEFAHVVSADLNAQGVRCWVFSERVRGSALVDRHSTSDQEEVERWIRNYDKMIVVGTAGALDTEAILKDITQAKERQMSEDKWVLFLVSADDTLVRPSGRSARSARNLSSEHMVFDLRGYKDDRAAYEPELSRLAEALKQEQPAAAGAPVVDFQL